MVHKGSDVSIGTQLEEESMQRPWIIETTKLLRAQSQRNYDLQSEGSETDALIKDG